MGIPDTGTSQGEEVSIFFNGNKNKRNAPMERLQAWKCKKRKENPFITKGHILYQGLMQTYILFE
jgi:hypothetical protein